MPEEDVKKMKFDKIIMNPPYTYKVEKGRKRALDLDYPIYKLAIQHSDNVVCLMRRSQKYKKDGLYTGYEETVFEGVGVEVAIFEHISGKPVIKIKSKYEENGKLDWIRKNDLTRKSNATLYNVIDRDCDKFKDLAVVPSGYVAFNEVSGKNFSVFTPGEMPHKKNSDEPLKMLVWVKTKDPIRMKEWLLNTVNPLHNEFRQFSDNNIDRGFTRTIRVPDDLLPEGYIVHEIR